MDYLSRRMYIAILTLGIFLNIVITFLFYAQSIKVIEATSEENLKSILDENSMMIENYVENTELLSHQLCNIIEITIPYERVKNNPEEMQQYKEQIGFLFLNAIKIFNAKSGWVIFDSEVIPGENTISYRKEGTAYFRQEEYDVKKEGYDKDSWWKDPFEKGSAWSTPYYWERWNSTIITYSEQVNVGDTIIGIGGSELFFDDITNQLKSVKIYDTGYVTLLNENYEVLFDPKSEFIGKNYASIINGQYRETVKKIKEGKDYDIIEFKEGDKLKVIGYKKLSNGWILIANPNKYEMYGDLNRLNFLLMIVIVIMIILVQSSSRMLDSPWKTKATR